MATSKKTTESEPAPTAIDVIRKDFDQITESIAAACARGAGQSLPTATKDAAFRVLLLDTIERGFERLAVVLAEGLEDVGTLAG